MDRVILDYLHVIAKAPDDAIQKRLLARLIREYVILEKRVDDLFKNTLPVMVARVGMSFLTLVSDFKGAFIF
jgi:hypothetical protein